MKKSKEFLWENREQDLESVIRYHKFDVMFYRTNLLVHYQRVGAIMETLIPIAQQCYEGFDVEKARLITKYHDDYELLLKGGDIPLQYKLMMSSGQLSALEDAEVRAAKLIAKKYPQKVGKYKYLDLLLHAIHKDCPEAQLHSFADKHDGYNEAIHEVLAGNTIFLEPVINYVMRTFNNVGVKFNRIKEIFHKDVGNPFTHFTVVDLQQYFKQGTVGAEPYNGDFQTRKTNIPHYEAWKEITIKTFPKGLDMLTKQVEFHQKKAAIP